MAARRREGIQKLEAKSGGTATANPISNISWESGTLRQQITRGEAKGRPVVIRGVKNALDTFVRGDSPRRVCLFCPAEALAQGVSPFTTPNRHGGRAGKHSDAED